MEKFICAIGRFAGTVKQLWAPATIIRGLVLVCLSLTPVSAQSNLYSWCIVGYANVRMVPGYNLVANPLNLDGTNALSNILNSCTNCGEGVPDGTQVFVWDVNSQTFLAPATFSSTTGTWSTNFFLPPGKGFVIKATAPWTNTFVGNVQPCPGETNYLRVAGGNKFSFVASMLPLSGALTNAPFNFQPSDGDQLHLYAQQNQSYPDAFCFFNGYGWFDPNGSTNGPIVGIGQSFFVQHPGPDYYWYQWLPSQLAAAAAVSSSSSSAPLEIRSIRLKSNRVTLEVAQNGGAYDVQFSPEGASWTTIAANRKGSIWTGVRPANPQGYFRVIPGAKGGL